eukprot:14067686-Heterocapsa_arctica.AAC.1
MAGLVKGVSRGTWRFKPANQLEGAVTHGLTHHHWKGSCLRRFTRVSTARHHNIDKSCLDQRKHNS